MVNAVGTVAILWCADRQIHEMVTPSNNRHHRIFEELVAAKRAADVALAKNSKAERMAMARRC
jgi:hypothetical protein